MCRAIAQRLVNVVAGEVESMAKPSGQMSGNQTSMIGLCQEGKSSPDALRRSAGTNPFGSLAACVGLSTVAPIPYGRGSYSL